MTYPSLEQVEGADYDQLKDWFCDLHPPGLRAVGRKDFEKVTEQETLVINLIKQRFKELGGLKKATL